MAERDGSEEEAEEAAVVDRSSKLSVEDVWRLVYPPELRVAPAPAPAAAASVGDSVDSTRRVLDMGGVKSEPYY